MTNKSIFQQSYPNSTLSAKEILSKLYSPALSRYRETDVVKWEHSTDAMDCLLYSNQA